MSINIKNSEVESLLNQVVKITGESKTEAIKTALKERQQRLVMQKFVPDRKRTLLSFLQDEIWSQIPKDKLGISITKAEEEEILGFGEWGV